MWKLVKIIGNKLYDRRKECLIIFCVTSSLYVLTFISQFQDIVYKIQSTQDKHHVAGLEFLRNSRNLNDYLHSERDTTIINVKPSKVCQKRPSPSSSSSIEKKTDEDVLIVYFISSAPANRKARDAIRWTWGRHLIPRPIFFVGTTIDDSTTMQYLLDEAHLYQDIIVEDFLDVYHNLTLKTGFMLKHFKEYCPTARYLMKTDDDMFVNTAVIGKILRDQIHSGKGESMIGAEILSQPVQDYTSIMYMPAWLYWEEWYPLFLSGTGYIIPESYVESIYNEALRTKIIQLEDVFYTGIVANEQLNINRTHDSRFKIIRPFSTNYCLYKNLATAHKIRPHEFYEIWWGRQNDCSNFINSAIYKFFNIDGEQIGRLVFIEGKLKQ